jgi:hypothetical protein
VLFSGASLIKPVRVLREFTQARLYRVVPDIVPRFQKLRPGFLPFWFSSPGKVAIMYL